MNIVLQLTNEEINRLTDGTLHIAGCLTDEFGRVVRRPIAVAIEKSTSWMSNVVNFVSNHKAETAITATAAATIFSIILVGSKKKKERLKQTVENFNASFENYQECVFNGNITTYTIKNFLSSVKLLVSEINAKKFSRLVSKEAFLAYLRFIREYTIKLAEKNHLRIKLPEVSEFPEEFGLKLLEYYLEKQEQVIEVIKKRPAYPNVYKMES